MDTPFSISKGDKKTFAEQIGLVYVSPRDRETFSKNAYPTKRASQSALGFLAKGTWDDSGRSEGANAAQRIDSETKSLVAWARNEGFLIDPVAWEKTSVEWGSLEGASEHDVFRALNGSRVVKSTIPPNFGARGLVTEYAKNAMWANQLFGDDIEFAGVLSDETGTAIVITQPFYAGESPTQQEICDWFTNQGYESAGFNRWKHPITSTDIADTHEGNFIKDDDGVLFPIDLQILKIGTLTNEK